MNTAARAFGALSTLGIAFVAGAISSQASLPAAAAAVSELQSDEQNTISVFATASPSVVFVESTTRRRDPWTMSVFETPQGSGSGFVWDKDGHVVTNFHVIQGASSLQVTLEDGSSWPARVVGADPSKDIAVLSIDVPSGVLEPLPRGASTSLQVGQKVIAIGNPFGLDHSLSTGVISALGREIEAGNGRTITGVVQTDAAINPGNSGGPLLDSQARLIGVNTAIFSPSGASAGIGFAIPVDTVSRIVPEIVEHGRVRRAALGVRVVGDQVARRNGIDGVIVAAVDPDGPAGTAGLRGLQRERDGSTRIGDVIVAIGEHPVTDGDSLFSALESQRIGASTTVRILREGKEIEVRVKLGELD